MTEPLAEATHRLGKFYSDVSTPEHNEVFGDLIQFECLDMWISAVTVSGPRLVWNSSRQHALGARVTFICCAKPRTNRGPPFCPHSLSAFGSRDGIIKPKTLKQSAACAAATPPRGATAPQLERITADPKRVPELIHRAPVERNQNPAKPSGLL